MKLYLKIISFSYLIFISLAFLIPLEFFANNEIIIDKQMPNNNTSFIIHLIIFFILYLLFILTFKNTKKVLIFCILYSVMIEIFQIFTFRGFQIGDIMFNIIGIFISYFFFLFFIKKYSQNQTG